MYYTVGNPIAYNFGSYQGGVKKIDLSKDTVKQSLIYQTEIRIFKKLSQAKYYAQTLEILPRDYRGPSDRGLAPAIFTVELKDNVLLKDPVSEKIKVKPPSFGAKVQSVEIQYYVMNKKDISKVISAELNEEIYEFKSGLSNCNLI